MFAMAEDHLVSFILLIILNTGFSAEISVFVQTGASVQLDIQTQLPPQFYLFSWSFNTENIVTYITANKKVDPHSSYKNKVDFNDETFSLTLKNMQKNESGLYTARTTGQLTKDIVTYRVSVIDAVEAPVLTVNSFSSDSSCTVNFTCRAQDLIITSSHQNNRCSPEEVTSEEINTITLSCSEELIICNYSNPVSWKKNEMEIKSLCGGNERSVFSSAFPLFHMMLFTVISVAVIEFWDLIL